MYFSLIFKIKMNFGKLIYLLVICLTTRVSVISGNPTYSLDICEGSGSWLSCPVGSVVNIKQASYGRLSSKICPRGPHAVPRGGCRAVNSLSITRAQCDNEQRCYLYASNSVFGDPCYGTYKYLNVVYSCLLKDPTYSLNICEGRAGRLSCPVGKVINIKQASYGRLSSRICQSGPHTVPRGGCRAVNSLSLVRAQCSRRQSCSLAASNLVFGDPCFGTYKYLNVVYSCQ